uniref:Ig-like domain-containing protein n=1 Tax=Parastrongyloides trichosuri TaxID=131310 RepID=A0A0N5A4B9_PARTI
MIKLSRMGLIYFKNILLLLFITIVLSLNTIVTGKVQRIIEGPVNTTVPLGSTVVLRCQVENQEGKVQWVAQGYGLGTERDLPLFNHMRMIGSPTKGEYDLEITNVTNWDAGDYECQLSSSSDINNFEKSNNAYLEVLQPPSAIGIVDKEVPGKLHKIGNFVFAREGIPIEETCLVDKAHPPPEIYWAITKSGTLDSIVAWVGKDIPSKIQEKYFRNNELPLINGEIKQNKTFTLKREFIQRSKVKLLIEPKYDDMKLSCIILHATYNEPQLVSSTINMLYKPQVDITIDGGSDTLKQGEEARLICNVKAKPEADTKYTWYHNNELLKKATKKVLFIEHLIPDDHDSRFTCRVYNPLGSGSATITLNVKYEPKFISSSQVKVVNQSDMATFYCETHGNPKPKVFWRKTGDSQIISEGINFTIKNVQKWQTGEYECVATNKGFDPVILTHNLFIEGDLQVRTNETVYINSESSATLSCEFHGYPKPRDIIWTFNGDVISTGRPSKRFNIVQVEKNYGVDSKLIIYDVESADLGDYNCTASTVYTSVSAKISLKSYGVIYKVSSLIRKLDPDAILILLVVIMCGIVVPCLLGLLYCFYLQKHNKKKSVYRVECKKHMGDIQVECAAVDDVNFASVELLHSERTSSTGALIYNKVYDSINQNNPDLDFNASYGQGSYQGGCPVTFITNDSNSSQATTVIRYDGYGYNSGNGTSTFCNGDKGDFINMEPLREMITPDNESGTPLLSASADNNNPRDSPVSRISTHV